MVLGLRAFRFWYLEFGCEVFPAGLPYRIPNMNPKKELLLGPMDRLEIMSHPESRASTAQWYVVMAEYRLDKVRLTR